MLTSSQILLAAAQRDGYAIGAFNVYNLEGVLAVLGAAEELQSPVMLQIHPQALKYGGAGLVALCMEAARQANVPVSVHLDHCSSETAIREALQVGLVSIMADGSHLNFEANVNFTKQMVVSAHGKNGFVEAELGRLSGTEDGLTVLELEARLTDPDKAVAFVSQTGIDALAVCIGNVHGHYREAPNLDFPRLAEIRQKTQLPLVLHGASGLSHSDIHHSIELGICKFNVNTEVREAFVSGLGKTLSDNPRTDLMALMNSAVEAMRQVVKERLVLFGSTNRSKGGDREP